MARLIAGAVAAVCLVVVVMGAAWVPISGPLSGPAWAGDVANISVKEAYERAEKGELVLVDIRRPREWRKSGIPANSLAITMHQSRGGFLKAIRAAAGDPGKPIAFICAVGGRSRYLQLVLERSGIKNTINVLGGMFGTRRDIGWLKAGLPVRPWQGSGQN